MKLYVDLDKLELIEGPGFRNPVSALRFKRGDAARLEVVFLASGTTAAAIGDPQTLEIHFGAKLNGQYGTDYVVHSANWTMPDPEATTPAYSCTPSFNTTALNEALDLGGGESAEVALMGEITWREGGGEPTSTRTILVIVENDVNRGTEGTPLINPTPAEWLVENGVTVVYRTTYEGNPANSLPEVPAATATGSITIVADPYDGDTVSISHPSLALETFVFRDSPIDTYDVQIVQYDQNATLTNLAIAIATYSAILEFGSYPSMGQLDVNAKAELNGSTGNSVEIAISGTAFSYSPYLSGGANGIPEVLAILGASPGQQCRVGDVAPYDWYRWTGQTWEYLPRDADLVHRSNPETIAGSKTFTGQMELTGQAATNATSAMTRKLAEHLLVDPAVVLWRDDFFGGTDATQGFGELSWNFVIPFSAAATSYRPTSAEGYGIANLFTNNVHRSSVVAQPDQSNIGAGGFTMANLHNDTTVIYARFKLSSLNCRARVGFTVAINSGDPFRTTRFFGIQYTKPAAAWTASTAITLNEYRRPTVANGRRYYASVAGTTAATQPTWPTTAGGTVVDGSVTWTEGGSDGTANFQLAAGVNTNNEATWTYATTPFVAAANTWYLLKMRWVSGNTWAASINGGTETIITTPIFTGYLMVPVFGIESAEAVAQTLSIDFFSLFSRITRPA